MGFPFLFRIWSFGCAFFIPWGWGLGRIIYTNVALFTDFLFVLYCMSFVWGGYCCIPAQEAMLSEGKRYNEKRRCRIVIKPTGLHNRKIVVSIHRFSLTFED